MVVGGGGGGYNQHDDVLNSSLWQSQIEKLLQLFLFDDNFLHIILCNTRTVCISVDPRVLTQRAGPGQRLMFVSTCDCQVYLSRLPVLTLAASINL